MTSPSARPAALEDPRPTMAAFAAAIGRGDHDAAVACFREDACLISPGARIAAGHEAIHSSLAELFGRENRVEVLASALEWGRGLAVGTERWRVRSLGPVWKLPSKLEATVVLRDIEGAWKLVVATFVAE